MSNEIFKQGSGEEVPFRQFNGESRNEVPNHGGLDALDWLESVDYLFIEKLVELVGADFEDVVFEAVFPRFCG